MTETPEPAETETDDGMCVGEVVIRRYLTPQGGDRISFYTQNPMTNEELGDVEVLGLLALGHYFATHCAFTDDDED